MNSPLAMLRAALAIAVVLALSGASFEAAAGRHRLRPAEHGQLNRAQRTILRWGRRAVDRGLVRVHGRENVPATGPVILAPNHPTYIDPIVVALGSSRYPHFMAKHGLFKLPPIARALRHLGAFPVVRGARDPSARTITLDHMAHGELVVIFPEGTTHIGKRSVLNGAAIKKGVSWFAAQSGATVVPVHVEGTEELVLALFHVLSLGRRGAPLPPDWHLGVTYGAPLPRPTGESVEQRQAELHGRLGDAIREVAQVARGRTTP